LGGVGTGFLTVNIGVLEYRTSLKGKTICGKIMKDIG